MGRKIELDFYDKKYTIEYNRYSVKCVLTNNKSDEPLNQAINLIKCGLIMHHENELPTDDVIFGWVVAMGKNLEPFAEELRNMVQDVLKTFEEDRKNLKWAKVEA